MKLLLSYTKIFTVLIAIFYIFALLARYFHHEILFSFIAFLFLTTLFLVYKLSYKKVLILLSIFFIGMIRMDNKLEIPNILDEFVSNETEISGQIITSKDISHKNNKIKFFMRVDKISIFDKTFENINSKFLVNLDYDKEIEKKIVIGDYLKLKGKLRHPKPSSNPYQFDYQRYLLNNDTKNILYADMIISSKELTKINNVSDFWYYILKFFEITRNKIIEKHSKNIHSPELEVLAGIVFGNETINPDEEIKENFKNSGLLHLLAASGLNVALIYSIWWWIASLIRFPYNLAILIGALFVVLYTFMTGFPPSILRASIMLLFVLFGKIIDRNASSVALIFFVGFLILLVSPKMIFDVGFQLSFVVTFGLLVCCPVILSKIEKYDKKYKEKYKDSKRITKYVMFLFSPINLASILFVPMVAQLWVLPIQIYYFNTFTPYSILANIIVVPFIGILSFIGFISSIIALIPRYSDFIVSCFDNLANPMLCLLIKITECFSSFKFSSVSTIGINYFQVFMVFILLLLLTYNFKNNFNKKKFNILFFILLLIFSLSFIQVDKYNKNLEIMMFDVDNADSFLIKTPESRYIMIDTGKKSYRGISDASMIMCKYLKNKRIFNIETMIITHFDMDHCSGTIDILKTSKVKQVIIQTNETKSKISSEILKYLIENKINYKIVENNEIVYREKDLTFKTISPTYKKKNIDNETSIVTLLNYKDKNILFMGDTGILGYQTIEKYLPNKINILKVGHHGAKSSTNQAMLDRLKPDIALISAGYGKFNHPHYDTIKLLEDNEIDILSTKLYGFIKVVLKNEDKNKIYYFDSNTKKLKSVKSSKENKTDFTESNYFKNFIKQEIKN